MTQATRHEERWSNNQQIKRQPKPALINIDSLPSVYCAELECRFYGSTEEQAVENMHRTMLKNGRGLAARSEKRSRKRAAQTATNKATLNKRAPQ